MVENPFLHYEDTHAETLDKMDIESKNHTTLFGAMGKEKYLSFAYGKGLKSNPKLQEELSKNGFTDAKYSIGTFNNERGEEETSLFISLELPSNNIIYECDVNSKKMWPFDMYEAKHIYILGKNGEATDLMEELRPTETKLMICPNKRFPFAGASFKENMIVLPDLRKFSIKNLGDEIMDFPVILHEIGHIKHRKVEPNIFNERAQAVMNLTSLIGLDRSKIEKLKGTLFDKLACFIEERAPILLRQEEIASSWACKWIEKNKEQGFNFWKSITENYWEQLDIALATYKNFWTTVENKAWSFENDNADKYIFENLVKQWQEQYPHLNIKVNSEIPNTINEENKDISPLL